MNFLRQAYKSDCVFGMFKYLDRKTLVKDIVKKSIGFCYVFLTLKKTKQKHTHTHIYIYAQDFKKKKKKRSAV